MKPIKLTESQMDAALGLESDEMDHEKTGNRKCWHVIDTSTGVERRRIGGMTRTQAVQELYRMRDASAHRVSLQVCRDGFKLIPCTGAAHDNPHIDNCMQCAPRWGWVMVPDKSTHVDWCDECHQAKQSGAQSDCPDAPKELRRDLTSAEKALLGALK